MVALEQARRRPVPAGNGATRQQAPTVRTALHPGPGRADEITVSTCPACLVAVAEGTVRCPACGIPFSAPVQGRPELPPIRQSRAMIPPPPVVRSPVVAPDPLASQVPHPAPQQPQQPQPDPELQPTPPSYAVGSSFVTASWEPEPTRWWDHPRLRDPRVLFGVPAAVVAVAVAALLVTGSRSPAVVEVPVPDVIGMDVLDAKNLLDGRGLPAPFAGLGTVVAQDPPAGEQVRPGTAVVLTIEPYPDPPAAPARSQTPRPTPSR